MKHGVIWSLKSKYRVLLVKRIITALENNKEIPSFSVLDAMKLLAWENVSEETIIIASQRPGY